MSLSPADPILFPVAGGKAVYLHAIGDEFYARLETRDGYTVLRDDQGGLTYARLQEGELASTGVSITRPPPAGLPRHLQEDPIKRRDKFSTAFSVKRGDDIVETFGPGGGGSEDDLVEIWSSDDHPGLAGLTGASGAGTWKVQVVDEAQRDIGTLEYVYLQTS